MRIENYINIPSSKSYAQRVLAADFLAGGRSVIHNLTPCGDTDAACRIVEDLRAGKSELNAAESGLAARMFTPIAAMTGRRITISGEGTLAGRPVGMMNGPLEQLGAQVECDGHLPITVEGRLTGGEVEVDGSISSQFITGLLLALPLAERDSIVRVVEPRSIPYLDMTVAVAEQFGVHIERRSEQLGGKRRGSCEFFIRGNQRYKPSEITIEGDWSAAGAMLVAGALAGEVTVVGLNLHSLQADSAILDVLARAEADITLGEGSVTVHKREMSAFDFDATDCPDLFPVLAVLASQCEGVSQIRGAERLIYKESNRARAIVEQLGALGIAVQVEGNEMTVRGGEIRGGVCDSVGDHRIAMAAGIAGLVSQTPVQVLNPEVVAKSYPLFWENLSLITKI